MHGPMNVKLFEVVITSVNTVSLDGGGGGKSGSGCGSSSCCSSTFIPYLPTGVRRWENASDSL
jgi:hypothetical protein